MTRGQGNLTATALEYYSEAKQKMKYLVNILSPTFLEVHLS